MMWYQVTITLAVEGPSSPTVAQLWADGIVKGIQHNRPEVIGAAYGVISVDTPITNWAQEVNSGVLGSLESGDRRDRRN